MPAWYTHDRRRFGTAQHARSGDALSRLGTGSWVWRRDRCKKRESGNEESQRQGNDGIRGLRGDRGSARGSSAERDRSGITAEQSDACLGHPLRVGLYAVSDDDPNSIKSIASLDAIIMWDPSRLQLLGHINPGTPAWVFSGFFIPDPYGLNESSPPQDGDGIYTALRPALRRSWPRPKVS